MDTNSLVKKTFRRKPAPGEEAGIGPLFKVTRIDPRFDFGKGRGKGVQDAVWFTRLDTDHETVHSVKDFTEAFEEVAEADLPPA
jgi:hypothetical protein